MVDITPSNGLDQVQIRYLHKEDLPALEWDGEYRHYRRLYGVVYEDMCLGRALMWVADHNKAGIIGQLFVQLTGSRKELADGLKRAYIYAVRIKPQFRSMGLGGHLLEIVEADLNERNYRWINLNVSRDNPRAVQFYERHHYRVIGAEPGRWSYLDHEGRRIHVHEPAWRMQKRIG